jgi:hypothetical protein
MTLVEIMFGMALLAVFFACVFQVNATCLKYIQASKESLGAMQCVHDRLEILRNLVFSDLVDPATVRTIMSTPPNNSDFGTKATEVVKLSAYPTANGVTQLTRAASGSVTIDSTAADLGDLVQVVVSDSWTGNFGRAPRSETSTTVISNGTKK